MRIIAISFVLLLALLPHQVDAANGNAETLLRRYDTGTTDEKRFVEATVVAALDAFREANNAIVIQRNELGLYCLPNPDDMSAQNLLEMIRIQIVKNNFVAKLDFNVAMLHALQTTFPCPLE